MFFWKSVNRDMKHAGTLKPHLEPEKTEDQNAPVRRRLRYLSNRPGQFDYPEAQAQGLPVGSGEIESACRWILEQVSG
jgi:hypothetical protein